MASHRTLATPRAKKRRQTTAAGTAPPPVERKKEPRPEDRGDRLLVVGVGASAGGLEAFQQLLQHLPLDTGLGFVLVQHLDPMHESALTNLLSRATAMPVQEATHNLRIVANHVYVIPPNRNISLAQGVLKLSARGPALHVAHAIDFFFESLAQDQRECAIGVVLSGAASDGTLGLEAIKAEGGVTFAQDKSAKYDSMPRSAIAAGVVDYVLAPRQIAEELARIATHPFVAHQPGAGAAERQAKNEAAMGVDGFIKILLLLGDHCGVDFSRYKSSTIQRRVMRRLVLSQRDTLAEYAAFLKGNAKELDALYSDVLIGVTSFFRNPEAFAALQHIIIPKLLAKRAKNEPVRLWVPGCSTGQEAYSLAMAFAEGTAEDARPAKLQIFATDLNEASLKKARYGLYVESFAKDLSPERLRRFFVEEEGGWRVSKALREQVVFARHNVISDPPFSQIDLISCRNLLIYLEPALQKTLFPMFHYALKPGGFLFLGASESIGPFTDLFAPADKKQKIFSRKAALTQAFRLPVPAARTAPSLSSRSASAPSAHEPVLPKGLRGEFTAQREADRISTSQFVPPGVLVDAGGQVLQFRGATGAYLEPPVGKASFDVLKMAREGLMLPLRAALAKAKRENRPVRHAAVRMRSQSGTRAVALHIIPLRNLTEPCFLILFEDAAASRTARALANVPLFVGKRHSAGRIAELERELADMRDDRQSIQEQNEAAHEELQASSEEMQSSNEELQSMNEELQTSKEELESTNEELSTINDEMISRNIELHRLNDDLNNVQVSIQTAILILARDLTIRRFTPLAATIFNLRATDMGRGIGDIRHNLDLPDLDRVLAEVVDTVSLREREVRDKEGRWYGLRARPYLTLDNKINGVVLVLSDIDRLKRSEQEASSAREYAEAILHATPVPFLVLQADLRVNTASEAFYKTFQVAPDATEGRLVYEIGNGQWNIPQLRELLEEIIPQRSVFNGFEVTHEFASLGRCTMLLNARRMEGAERLPERILLAIEDITEFKQADAVRARLAAIVESSDDAIIGLDLNSTITSWNRSSERLFGYTEAAALGQPILMLVPPDLVEQEAHILARLRDGDIITPFETKRRHKDGTLLDVSLTDSPILDAQGRIVGLSKIARNITTRKRAQAVLHQNAALLSRLVEQAPTGMYIVDAKLRMQQVNELAAPVFSTVHPLIGRDFSEIIKILWGPEIGERIAGRFRHTLKTGERYISPPFVERRDDIGEEQAYDWQIQRLTLADGEYGVVCYFHEITELQRTERALRESEARMRLATEATAVGIWEWNIFTNRIWWDPQMFKIYGIAPTPDGVVDYSDWSGAVLPEDLPRAEEVLQDTIRRCGVSHRAFRILRHNDGECRHIEAVETVRANVQGLAEWVLGTNLDITERLQAQEQLRRLTSTLEARVVERTQELAASHDRLRALAIELTIAEQTERRRLATELHDFLAQLLVVARMKVSQVLKRDHNPDVRTILHDTDQLLHQSLDYTRSLVSELTPQALYERGLFAGLQWLADQMRRQQLLNVEISIEVPELPMLEVAKVLLFHSVRELLFNVLKHSNTDRALVSMRYDQGLLSLTVSDQGCGFDVSKLSGDHFNRFGLLSIRERMLALGGGFELHSEVGKGTSASLHLPVLIPDNGVEAPVVEGDGQPPLREAANRRTPRPASVSLPDSEGKVVTPLRVLIVDDQQMVREGLCAILKEHDDLTLVGEASTGKQALELVGTLRPDVVIMDMQMPGWNGAETTRRILAEHPATIVIGLSIQTNPHVAESMLEAGVTAFLPKEASGEALYITIQTAVGRNKPATSSSSDHPI